MALLDWRGYTVAAWVCVLALAAGMAGSIVQRNWSGVVIQAIGLAVALAVTLWGRRELAPLFVLLFDVALAVNALGYAWHLFTTVAPYDELVHGFTIFTLTLAFGIPIFRRLAPDFERHQILFVVTVASFGIAVGALWEVAEWLLAWAGVAIVASYSDTILDLVMDTLGALLAALVSLWVLGEQRASVGGVAASRTRDTL